MLRPREASDGTVRRVHSDLPRAAVPTHIFDQVSAEAPAGVEVLEITDDLDLDTIDFIVASGESWSWRPLLRPALPNLTRVRFVHCMSAGTDWIEPLMPPQATLANSRGARDAPVAEWIFGALLGVTSRLLEWAPRNSWPDDERRVDDLSSWTIVVIGMGSIGHTLARMLAPIGPRVIGVASRARDDLHGIDELPQLLPQADALVILTPLTDATRGLIGAAELGLLRDGAVVINAGRGPVLDTEALVAETTAPRLRAVLDVTDPEPLPDGHPLWSAPGVLAITPHLSGSSDLADGNATALAITQLTRWVAGEPPINVVHGPSGS
jgi:phosphoglycerate dehydrogenase-like enzyme